jgi:hypothetical protein
MARDPSIRWWHQTSKCSRALLKNHTLKISEEP